MKFEQDLQQTAIPEWRHAYIDYKGLKAVLSTLLAAEQPEPDSAPFFAKVDDELEKVNRFFLEKVTAYEAHIETIIESAEPQQATSVLSQSGLQSPTPGMLQADVAEPASPTELPGAAAPPAMSPSSASADFKTLKSTFTMTYAKLGQLQSYVWLNQQGFSKIMKKFDKKMQLRGTGGEKSPEFERKLATQPFLSARLDTALERGKEAREAVKSAKDAVVTDATEEVKLMAGSGNPLLAQEIAGRLGIPLTPIKVGRFADGEVQVQLNDSVRGADVYIVQPTCSPVNDNLMELLLLISAARRASANRVTAVVPYYGYARQDRKDRSRVPISAADVARMFEAMGVDRMICIDLHCGQIQGFFGPRTPVDNLYASPIAWSFFSERNLVKPVVISPDAGGVARAKLFREGLVSMGTDASLAVIIKQRSAPGVVGRTDLVGSVDGSDCIIVDDMIDTAGTLCAAANELRQFGAKRVFAFATHGLFNGPAGERIESSVLENVIVANTIPLRDELQAKTKKIRQLSVGKLLSVAIHSCHSGESVSHLFDANAGARLLA